MTVTKKYKCKKCNFEAKSVAGLKTHARSCKVTAKSEKTSPAVPKTQEKPADKKQEKKTQETTSTVDKNEVLKKEVTHLVDQVVKTNYVDKTQLRDYTLNTHACNFKRVCNIIIDFKNNKVNEVYKATLDSMSDKAAGIDYDKKSVELSLVQFLAYHELDVIDDKIIAGALGEIPVDDKKEAWVENHEALMTTYRLAVENAKTESVKAFAQQMLIEEEKKKYKAGSKDTKDLDFVLYVRRVNRGCAAKLTSIMYKAKKNDEKAKLFKNIAHKNSLLKDKGDSDTQAKDKLKKAQKLVQALVFSKNA